MQKRRTKNIENVMKVVLLNAAARCDGAWGGVGTGAKEASKAFVLNQHYNWKMVPRPKAIRGGKNVEIKTRLRAGKPPQPANATPAKRARLLPPPSTPDARAPKPRKLSPLRKMKAAATKGEWVVGRCGAGQRSRGADRHQGDIRRPWPAAA